METKLCTANQQEKNEGTTLKGYSAQRRHSPSFAHVYSTQPKRSITPWFVILQNP
jgi:hypothetical protein